MQTFPYSTFSIVLLLISSICQLNLQGPFTFFTMGVAQKKGKCGTMTVYIYCGKCLFSSLWPKEQSKSIVLWFHLVSDFATQFILEPQMAFVCVEATGNFSGLCLAELKQSGSWDVHYLGNPITLFGPIWYNPFTLGPLCPPWTQNPPHGPCNSFVALLRHGPSTHHLAKIKSLQ